MITNAIGVCEIPVTKISFEKNFNLFVYCMAKKLQENSKEKFKTFQLKQLIEEVKKIDPSLSKEKEVERLIQHWIDSSLVREDLGGCYYFII